MTTVVLPTGAPSQRTYGYVARIRSVKPEFWDDRKLARRTSRDARLLYIALWNLADEHCRLNGDPQWLKGQVFAFDDDLDTAAIDRLLKELETVGSVVRYEVDEDPFILLPKLAKHQRLEPEKVRSRIPAPPAMALGQLDFADWSGNRANQSARGADSSENGANSSALLYVAGSMEHVVAGAEAPPARKRATRIPEDFAPSPEMLAWARQECPGVDLKRETEKFVNYWTAKSGSGAAKLDWAATWRNWMIKAFEDGSSGRGPGDRRQAAVSPRNEHRMRR